MPAGSDSTATSRSLTASLAARLPAPSRRVRIGVGVAAVISQIAIAVTGSVVRVTGSGLGCPTFPHCSGGSFVPISDPTLGQVHQWIEFGNRMLVFVVAGVSAVCVITALLARPYRKRYVWLSLVMPLGIVAEALIGGLTVLAGLVWWTVAIHFLVSPVLIMMAVLFYRATTEGDEPPRPVVARRTLGLASVLLALLLVAGTLVTAAGPHAGDERTPRLDLPIPMLTGIHGGLLGLFLLALTMFGFQLWRAYPAERTVRLRRRFGVLVGAVLAQGALGIVQYFLGVPMAVVPIHVLGAGLVVAGVVSLWCATRDRGPVPATGQVPASSPVETPAAAAG